MRITTILKLLRMSYKPQLARHYSEEAPKALRSLKAKSTRSTVQFYVDSCRVRAVAGDGGDGCVSFLSAWCNDKAGPDGGDGGHGGHVVFQASHSVRSLNHVRAVVTAPRGERGYNKDCCGKNAQHVVVPVPIGTIIKSLSGQLLCDLSSEGAMFVAARGGAGGRGNRFFLTDTEQAPSIAEYGATGEQLAYTLEVRAMAHVGLLGCPNAGKSTLVRAVTRARPAVAPHAFTTLRPHIGMIPYSDYEQVALADLPGLIAGSHRNRGLGIQFLQHIERCRGLIYLLDGANSPLDQYHTLCYELQQYNAELFNRPSLIVVNKIDLDEGKQGLQDVIDGFREVKREFEEFDDKREVRNKNEQEEGFKEVIEGFREVKRGFEEVEKDFVEVRKKMEREDSEQEVVLKNVNSLKDKVIGISAKNGVNVAELLRLVRVMYDSGGEQQS